MKSFIIKTLLLATLILAPHAAKAQVKEFQQLAETDDITYVYISKFMLQLAGAGATPYVPEVDMKQLITKLDAIQIITAESDKAAAQVKKAAQRYVSQTRAELLMQVDEDRQRSRIYYNERKGNAVLVMLNDDNEEVALIAFSGKFGKKDIGRLASQVKVKKE